MYSVRWMTPVRSYFFSYRGLAGLVGSSRKSISARWTCNTDEIIHCHENTLENASEEKKKKIFYYIVCITAKFLCIFMWWWIIYLGFKTWLGLVLRIAYRQHCNRGSISSQKTLLCLSSTWFLLTWLWLLLLHQAHHAPIHLKCSHLLPVVFVNVKVPSACDETSWSNWLILKDLVQN